MFPRDKALFCFFDSVLELEGHSVDVADILSRRVRSVTGELGIM